jgi:hypothetical protein
MREEFLNDTETYFHPAGRALAYSGVKTVATKGLGLVRSPESAKYAPDWFRPDWWIIVVELAKARLLSQIKRAYEETGLVPVAVATDCVYYLCKQPEHIPFEVNLHKLGGFKEPYRLQVNPEIAEKLNRVQSGGAFTKVVRTHRGE